MYQFEIKQLMKYSSFSFFKEINLFSTKLANYLIWKKKSALKE